jgi:hypothetical protein
MLWTGRVVSALASLPFLPSAFFKLSQNAMAVEGFEKMGWPANTLLPLGIAEIAGVILYAIPQTAVLGAILLTGYLGGAIAAHVSHGESFLVPAVIGVLVWLGLYLRDARVRDLLPIRSFT